MSIIQNVERFRDALLLPLNKAACSIFGLYSVVWGIWVCIPAWDVFSQAQAFRILAAVPPEWIWGAIAIAIGACVVYGAYQMNENWLRRASAWAGWYWFMLAVSFVIGDWHSMAFLTFFFISLYFSYIYLNLKVNRKTGNEKSLDWLSQ